jgi:glucose-1-phosphate thymidylyltransferase
LEASNYIAAIQNRQGLMIACLEEIAFHQGWIDAHQLHRMIEKLPRNEYRRYLEMVLSEGVPAQPA